MTATAPTGRGGMGHREVRDAIPWLVNGTLDADEAARVRAHLEGCPACAAELAWQRRLAAAMVALEPPAFDARASWDAIEARLGPAGPAPLPPPRRAPARAPAPEPRGARPLRPARLALGGGLAAALLAAVVLLPPRGDYGTLTEGAPATEEAGTLELRVRPAPGADPAAVLAALEAAGARRVEGPSTSGLLRAHVPAEARDAALAALRADPLFLVVASD